MVLVALAALVVVAPLGVQRYFRFHVSAAEEARIEAAWTELEAWADEVTSEPRGEDGLALVLDLVQRAEADDPVELYDDSWELRDDLTLEELPESWRVALAGLLAWHRADGGAGYRAEADRIGYWLVDAAMAVRAHDPELAPALMRYAHTRCTRGKVGDWLEGMAVRGALLVLHDRGVVCDADDIARWRPRRAELVATLLRAAVEADRDLEPFLEEEARRSSDPRLTSERRRRFERLRFRQLATELLLPFRGQLADFDQALREAGGRWEQFIEQFSHARLATLHVWDLPAHAAYATAILHGYEERFGPP